MNFELQHQLLRACKYIVLKKQRMKKISFCLIQIKAALLATTIRRYTYLKY